MFFLRLRVFLAGAVVRLRVAVAVAVAGAVAVAVAVVVAVDGAVAGAVAVVVSPPSTSVIITDGVSSPFFSSLTPISSTLGCLFLISIAFSTLASSSNIFLFVE